MKFALALLRPTAERGYSSRRRAIIAKSAEDMDQSGRSEAHFIRYNGPKWPVVVWACATRFLGPSSKIRSVAVR